MPAPASCARFSCSCAVATYRIPEVSADLRERQRQTLSGLPVTWLDALPEKRIDGLVLANEVLDAVPCEGGALADDHYQQARVTMIDDHFEWRWRLLDGPLLTAAKHRIPPVEGYQSEINLEAEALVATLASRLGDGALCFIDYGFSAPRVLPRRTPGGTLACHYRQWVHFDPLILVGLQDVTAHVDFTAMAEAAVDGGAGVICYATQAQFLLHGGLLNRCRRQFASEAARQCPQRRAKLVSPAEMGELFKVLVVGKGEAVEQLARWPRGSMLRL